MSKANKATTVSMLPVLVGDNGIWWAVTLAEVLAAVVALWYLIPESRTK